MSGPACRQRGRVGGAPTAVAMIVRSNITMELCCALERGALRRLTIRPVLAGTVPILSVCPGVSPG